MKQVSECVEREIIGDGVYVSTGHYIDTGHIDTTQAVFWDWYINTQWSP